MANKRPFRTSQEFSKTEVNLTAIPLYRHGGRLLGPEESQVGGAVPKDTLVIGDLTRPDLKFIAKRPRKWQRECVTEAMLSTIARTLPLSIARYRLVRFGERRSATDIRFLSQVFLRPGEALVHGVEIAARFLDVLPDEVQTVFALDDKRSEREFYTVEFIIDMLGRMGRNPSERRGLIAGFVRMVTFDAFVGVQDRHAENWGVVECTIDQTRPLRFAPLFDTARGIFVSHGDDKLESLDRDNGRASHVSSYAERSAPIFGCRCEDVKKVNHFRLVEHMVTSMGDDVRRAAGSLVRQINLAKINKRLQIEYASKITKRRFIFVMDLLTYRHRRLLEIVR